MKIDQEEFNRKAEHIIETVVKPQVEKYERAKAIEEAATNYLHKVADGKRCTGYADEDFIEGAKWQQKKMFTEEQLAIAMLDFGLYIAENRGKPIDTDNKIKEIIEQFKQQEQ
jgi:hypothetical protein